MAVRTVLRLGDPRLRRVAAPVTETGTPELAALVADLFDTMAVQRGVGLAAPQIGVSLRVVVFGYACHPLHPEAPAVPPTALVNPVIESLGPEQAEDWEGCLSVPGLRGRVARWARIRYRGLDPQGRPIERVAGGFHARVVQHECDHLDGVLYVQRMRDLDSLGFVDELYRAGALGPVPALCEDPRAPPGPE